MTVTVGVVVHQITYSREVSDARAAAQRQLADAARTYARNGTLVRGACLDSPRVPAELRELTRRGRQGTDFGSGPDGPGMWAARPVGDRMLCVHLGLREEIRSLRELDITMAVAGLLGVALVVPLGAVSAERLARRLRSAADTALTIADGDLDARINAAPRPGDEIADISAAVDSMAAALQQRLHSEQRFTADVAHELRTPLTGLVTSAELLPPGKPTGFVQDRVRALHVLVEDLLEVARLDAGAEQADLAPCPLGELIPACVAHTEHRATVCVTRDATVRTDPRRVERILTNLVSNAYRHGRPPVTVTVDQVRVTVRDHGPGFPKSLLAEGPQRFRTGAPERGRGQGLGLTIAKAQAQLIGADLVLDNAPGGGAQATLVLPAQD
ncbi:HAMP domain-containing sensor histidine kinase [Streptomyces spirodelae]|uniref:HAMP domain-containing sensor histidine kinase n=1 Tax=Streptomyces spirodelae TaxID=2812904 RepID=UPI0027DE18AB|nr:HAMP domain-containing sensor histidine kinase [Streptomyces spirodelae]